MISALAWLVGSKAGRITAVVLLALVSAALVIWQAFRKGQISERAKQTQASLDNLRSRIATDDEIARLDRAGRRDALRRWVSDDR